MNLEKLNLHPAEYYEEYYAMCENDENEFFKLPRILIDATYLYITREKEDKIVAVLSANYAEHFKKNNLYFIGSPLVKIDDEELREVLFRCLSENHPWEYYYPEDVKFLEEVRKNHSIEL